MTIVVVFQWRRYDFKGMEARFGSLLLRTSISLSFTFCFILTSSSHIPIGIHPLDEKYFASDVINCRDGSSSFTRDRINDDFCDCADGTDEPGTSACPTGKFYCRNAGSTPRFLFSSRVNDQVCDCCDGSDEYDGSVACPNTCVMGGNAEYNTINYGSRIKNLGSRGKKRGKSKPGGEDSAQKLQGLKIVIIVQVVVISALAFWLFRRRVKSRRRNPRS